jgi:hypothetical protein
VLIVVKCAEWTRFRVQSGSCSKKSEIFSSDPTRARCRAWPHDGASVMLTYVQKQRVLRRSLRFKPDLTTADVADGGTYSGNVSRQLLPHPRTKIIIPLEGPFFQKLILWICSQKTMFLVNIYQSSKMTSTKELPSISIRSAYRLE